MRIEQVFIAATMCVALVTCAGPPKQPRRAPGEVPLPSVRGQEKARSEAETGPDLAVLPGGEEAEGFLVTEPAKGYAGEELFDLISGGAVQFFDHGFEWAVAGAYKQLGGGGVSAEVYRMSSPGSAKAIFEERKGGEVEPAAIGDDSRIVYSAVEFRRGSFYVVLVSHEAGESGKRAALDLARIIDGRLHRN